MIPMERTPKSHGVYHVLGGALSPIDEVDPEDLKIRSCPRALPRGGRRSGVRTGWTEPALSQARGVHEIVLATNPTTTGEATALHIAEELRARAPELPSRAWQAACPVGSDLEYADEVTLGKAFAGRRAV